MTHGIYMSLVKQQGCVISVNRLDRIYGSEPVWEGEVQQLERVVEGVSSSDLFL